MKKGFALLLCAVLAFGVMGCEMPVTDEQAKQKAEDEAAKISTDLRSGEFVVDGNNFSFPMHVSDLIDAGWYIISEDSDTFLLDAGYDSVDFQMKRKDDDDARLTLKALNLSEEPAKLDQCWVEELKLSSTYVDFVLPGGIYPKSTQADVESAYGEADWLDEDEYRSTYYYTFIIDEVYKCQVSILVYHEENAPRPCDEVTYTFVEEGEDGTFLTDYTGGMSDEQIFEVYLDNLMNTLYHGDYEEYVKSGMSTEEEARSSYETAMSGYADALLHYIGVDSEDVDADVKARYVDFAKKVLAKTDWEIENVSISPSSGDGGVDMKLCPTTLFDVVEEPLADVLAAFQQKHAGTNVDALSKDEQAALETELAESAIETMEGLLDQIQTGEGESSWFTIKDFTFADSEWTKIAQVITDMK